MSNYNDSSKGGTYLFESKRSPDQLQLMRKQNNPQDEPVGDFTGRCRVCGSNNLWDDNLHYGCNSCGAFLK